MNKYFKYFFVFMTICIQARSQTALDSILFQIKKNNLRIKTNNQIYEAEKIRTRTGNSLYNPTVEYDYLTAKPEETGNHTEFTISQSFDFPTVYLNKNKAANIRNEQLGHEANTTVQDILFEAKIVCLNIIYRNRLRSYLLNLASTTQRLVTDYEKKLDSGDGNMLDVNKSRLMLLEADKDLADNDALLRQLNQTLVNLNGGFPISLIDTVYVSEFVPPFDQLVKDFENADPKIKSLKVEFDYMRQQVKVSRSQGLPKMELGYHYQGIPGQEFSGFHSGITIPLWENRNKVRLNKALLLQAELGLQTYRSEKFTQVKNLYDQYETLKRTLNEYVKLIGQANQELLLNKAITSGYINTIEYFMEVGFYRNAQKRYLEMEAEYHKVIATLLKHQL